MIKNNNKKIKLKKWHVILIVILIFIFIYISLFIKKIIYYKNSIERGDIILESNVGEYSSYGGLVNIKQSTVTRAEIESSDDPWTGSEKPIMTIVEFADFNCPYCLSAYTDLKLFVDKNKNDVKLIYRDFPISSDITPSLVANCANEQGKFWQMHDKLFENQRILEEKAFLRFAKELGLDMDKFQDCYSTKKYESEVFADVNVGLKAGISGTPTFFVNGEKFQGVTPAKVWDQILQSIKNKNLNK